MLSRYLFRKESFGGLIIDQDNDLEIMLNSSAFLIGILNLGKQMKEEAIINYLKEKYQQTDTYELEEAVKSIVKDLRIYFTSKNKEKYIWNSDYSPTKDVHVLSSPISVFWEITSGCNLRCLHCYNSSAGMKKDDLNTKECMDLIKELSQLDVSKLLIGGGEPFTREDLLELIEYADDLDLNILIATNGTLISEEMCSRLNRIKKLKLDISMYHYRPEKHDAFCGVKGAFNRVKENITLLNQFNIKYGVQTMLTEENKHELRKFQDFLIDNKARNWNIKTGVNIGRELENKACLNDKDVLPLKEKMDELVDAAGNKIQIHFEMPMARTIKGIYQHCNDKNIALSCGPGYRNCGILPNGHIIPCSFLRGDKWVSEYSVREKSFKYLWDNSKVFLPFRNLNSSMIETCNNCSLLGDGCNGGCRARSENECGNFYKRDPRCKLLFT